MTSRLIPAAARRLAPFCLVAVTIAMPAGAIVATPDFGRLPLSFEANRGQTDASVRFLARGQGYGLFLTDRDAVVELGHSVVTMHLTGATRAVQASGEEPQGGTTNYLVGNDPDSWKTGIRTFARVRYPAVYPGIDLVYYGNQRQLEYDFIVAPGADPSAIGIEFKGAAAHVGRGGDLALTVHDEQMRLHKPVIYQMDGQIRRAITGRYVVERNSAHFKVGHYDRHKPLIIDPVLSYETYLGGNDSDTVGSAGGPGGAGQTQSQGLAVDPQGNVYVTGSTVSLNFPLANPYQSTANHKQFYTTVFVTKLNPTGTALVYSTFLGGSVIDSGTSIAVDAAGSAYVVGSTISPDFPVTAGALQTVCSPQLSSNKLISSCGYEASSNAFVTKLSPDGQSLVYSTFLGGDDALGGDGAYGVTVDAAGRAYVVGVSADPCDSTEPAYYCFPTTPDAFVSGTENASGPGNRNTHEGFLSVLNAAGSALVYSTLLSHTVPFGSGLGAVAVALDAGGNIYVTGSTTSGNLSTSPGAFQTSSGPVQSMDNTAINIYERAFVAKFGPVGAAASPALTYLTYLGGTTTTGINRPTGIAADAAGNAYIWGYGFSESDLPTTAGVYQATCDGGTGYLAKLNPAGSALVWATCIGGGGHGTLSSTSEVVLDAAGNVYVAGSGANDMPQVYPIQTNRGGDTQAFVAKFDPTGAKLLFSTLVGDGGTGGQYAAGLAIDAVGGIYLAGDTFSGGLPVTAGAPQATYGGGPWDGFIAKISLVPLYANGQLLIPTITAGNLTYSNVVVTVTGIVSGPTGSAPHGTTLTYNSVNRQLSIPEGTIGTRIFYNTVVTVGNLVSIASVTGADTYSGGKLTIPVVQVIGGSTYKNVVVAVTRINGIAGGIPKALVDQYDPASRQLLIPVIEVGGTVYTNVTVTIGTIG